MRIPDSFIVRVALEDSALGSPNFIIDPSRIPSCTPVYHSAPKYHLIIVRKTKWPWREKTLEKTGMQRTCFQLGHIVQLSFRILNKRCYHGFRTSLLCL